MSEFSTQAVQAKKFLQSKGFDVSHCLMLEMLSTLEGFRNFQTRKAIAEQEPLEHSNSRECRPAIVADPHGDEECDFVLQPGHISAWVKVDNQLVYIVRTDEGLVVDVHAHGDLTEALASTYSFTQEAVDEHVQYIQNSCEVGDSGFEAFKDLCKSAGLCVEEDCDQPGLWIYKVHSPEGRFVEGREMSFDNEKDAWLAAYQEHYATQLRQFTPAARGR